MLHARNKVETYLHFAAAHRASPQPAAGDRWFAEGSFGCGAQLDPRWKAGIDTSIPEFNPQSMQSQPRNVGLGGDGDEIAAIREVEEEFGVTLDYSDAHNWTTVADVYAALLDQLSAEEVEHPGVWNRFSEAICRETGISPSSISVDSGLIAEDGLWGHVVEVSPFFWPLLLSLLSLVVVIYGIINEQWFYQLAGCRGEDHHPAVAFLFLGFPLSLTSILLALLARLFPSNGSSVARHFLVAGSVVSTLLCLLLVGSAALGEDLSYRCR